MRTCEKAGCSNPVFGTDKKTKIGYCRNHQYLRSDLKKFINKKTLKEKGEPANNELLDKWFDKIMKIIEASPYCWECGKYIPKPFYRMACAHILPKRQNYGFPSVATHDLNFLILGAGCGCHSKYDMCWEDAQKMKVWSIAVERFQQFRDFIDASEANRIPDVFLFSNPTKNDI